MFEIIKGKNIFRYKANNGPYMLYFVNYGDPVNKILCEKVEELQKINKFLIILKVYWNEYKPNSYYITEYECNDIVMFAKCQEHRRENNPNDEKLIEIFEECKSLFLEMYCPEREISENRDDKNNSKSSVKEAEVSNNQEKVGKNTINQPSSPSKNIIDNSQKNNKYIGVLKQNKVKYKEEKPLDLSMKKVSPILPSSSAQSKIFLNKPVILPNSILNNHLQPHSSKFRSNKKRITKMFSVSERECKRAKINKKSINL